MSNKISLLFPIDALPSDKFYSSPLKRKRNEKLTQLANEKLKSSLFQQAEKKQKIEIKTEIPFLEQKIIEEQSVSIRFQLETFQRSLHQSYRTHQEYVDIITLIKTILQNPEFNEKDKLIELGILHYYFASNKIITIVENLTFLEHRIFNVEKEASKLMDKHEQQYGSPKYNLPSGCTTYLMRSFSRMIFPPDGSFNLGGCYAVIALLDSKINAHLIEEMRAQVINITQKFIDDESFRLLFHEPFEVHPEMQKLICIDLKIPLHEKMSFVYVRWALVTALFSPIGQSKEFNCYAIAILINLLNDSPKTILQLMIESLRKGGFPFEGIEIPIPSLLEFQGHQEVSFNDCMTADTARSSVPYLMASEALTLAPIRPKDHSNVLSTINNWMSQDFDHNIQLAKKYYISHQISFLQQTVLLIFQFYAQNCSDSVRGKSLKTRFFQEFISSIKLNMSKLMNMPLAENDPLWDLFFSEFITDLMKSFFCVSCSCDDLKVEENRVIFNRHSQGFIFNGNRNDYKAFQIAACLIHFDSADGTYKNIDRLSTFAILCIEHLDKWDCSSDAVSVTQWRTLLSWYLQSPEFLIQMAKNMALINHEESSLDWTEYHKSDSLFLIQGGGYTEMINPILKEKFQLGACISGTCLITHFINLCQWVAKSPDQLGSFIVTEAFLHSFNIIPSLFQGFLKNTFDQLQFCVIDPGQYLTKQCIPFEKIEKTLIIALGSELGKAFVQEHKEHFDSLSLSYHDFAKLAKELLNQNDYIKFAVALNEVAESIPFNDFQENTSLICNLLNLDGLAFTFNGCEEKFINPFEGSKMFQEWLMALNPPIFISKSKIEWAIRNCFYLPQIIWIGNLNGIRDMAEQYDIEYLILKYDFVKENLIYAKYYDGYVRELSEEATNDLLKETELYVLKEPGLEGLQDS